MPNPLLNRPQERQEIKIITDQFDSAAKEKLLRVNDILHINEERDRVRHAYTGLCHEFNLKEKALESLTKEIEAQAYTLNRQKAQFEKENAARIKELEFSEKRVNAASEEYTKLTREVSDKRDELKKELTKITTERSEAAKESDRLNRHVKQVEDACKVREANVETALKKLEEDRATLEGEKELMRPEFARLSEIKNENANLWAKLENDRLAFEAAQKNFQSHKENQDAQTETLRESLRKKEEALEAERAKLLQIEQDLNDRLLEAKALKAEADKQMKRYQINQTLQKAEEVK